MKLRMCVLYIFDGSQLSYQGCLVQPQSVTVNIAPRLQSSASAVTSSFATSDSTGKQPPKMALRSLHVEWSDLQLTMHVASEQQSA